MSDISKCDGHDCPVKEHCFRFTAPSNEYQQSYGSFQYDHVKGTCEDYYKDTRGCERVKRKGESCPKNNKCTYPDCLGVI
jgi:hypothetical protein